MTIIYYISYILFCEANKRTCKQDSNFILICMTSEIIYWDHIKQNNTKVHPIGNHISNHIYLVAAILNFKMAAIQNIIDCVFNEFMDPYMVS